MNRIIIIGNGFDLAHGLKTSYRDFLIWHEKKIFDSEFCTWFETPGTRYAYTYNLNFEKINEISTSVNWKNNFLKCLVNKKTMQNWVDIEEEYFNRLNVCFQNYIKNKSIDSLTKLNQDFIQIKDRL
jgi:uncharacterized phage-associated protein